MAGVFENDKRYRVLMDMDNRKYSILIIAFECHYTHIERFIRNLKKVNPLVDITMLGDQQTITSEIKDSATRVIYKGYNHEGHRIKSRVLSKLLNKFSLLTQIRELASNNKFDIVNIHYPQYYMYFVMRYLHKMSGSIIMTPWGSDILRVTSKIKRLLLKYAYRQSDLVTLGPQGAVGRIIHKDFGVDEKRMIPLSWGSETIDFINGHLNHISREDAKRKLGFEDKYIITCGYNAFFEQRHLEMIDALTKDKNQLPSNLVLLFPVTYGTSASNQYISLLKKRCAESGLTAFFFEHYLSVEEIFYLRRASDMFIHVQTTDAGNSTVMEYCICGSRIVHGSWMHYKWLDFPPRFYFPVNDLNDLPSIILTAYKSENLSIPEDVITIIKNRGWEYKMVAWNNVFISRLRQ